MPRHVLVTGALGFVGRHVAKYFSEQGWIVTGIGRGVWNADEYQNWGISRWYSCQIGLESLTGTETLYDTIIHCAGGSSVSSSIEDPYSDFRDTVESTIAVLEYVRNNANTTLVYASSAAVYGRAEALPISEDSSLNPVSPYGLHKKICEELCRSYASQYGLSIAIVRMFSVSGPGLKKQILWDAWNKAKIGQSEFWGTGEETRDFLHVSDASSLLYAAGSHATPYCPTVNAGTGKSVSIQELISFLYKRLNIDLVPRFNNLTRSGDPTHYEASIVKAKNWGWEPEHSWETLIEIYADWLREEAHHDKSGIHYY